MTTLSDTQRILLSSASQRDSGSLLPLPASIKPGGGTAKALATLVNRGFAEERETGDATSVTRSDGDTHYGLFVTTAGLTAIGVEQPDAGDDTGAAAVEPPTPVAAKAASKTKMVIDLLTRPDGATLPELIAATGWLPHTTRAALTGIRKKGHAVTRGKRDGATCYRIGDQA